MAFHHERWRNGIDPCGFVLLMLVLVFNISIFLLGLQYNPDFFKALASSSIWRKCGIFTHVHYSHALDITVYNADIKK